jgi:hypothetical protein
MKSERLAPGAARILEDILSLFVESGSLKIVDNSLVVVVVDMEKRWCLIPDGVEFDTVSSALPSRHCRN